MIADAHSKVREGTRQILARDPAIEVVGEAEDGERALQLANSLKPDVLVLDLRLPKPTGLEVARRVQSEVRSTRVLVLTSEYDDDYVLAAMDAGAVGYLPKTARGEEIVAAVHAIARGEVVLQPAIASKIFPGGCNERAKVDDQAALTEREMDVLKLAALGLRNKDIADRLHLSIRTVEGHLSRTFRKLNVGSRTEAVLYAAAHGWLVIPNTV